ncbi:MAG: methionine adenosyltransferase, partial [Nanoarchaeota archaeon]
MDENIDFVEPANRDTKIMSSESVTEGHPDKMCDKISDAILDELLRQDKHSRVACETAAKNGGVMVFGEISTEGYVDIPAVVRRTLKDIGYVKSDYGIEYETASVWVRITEQSPDIAMGVDEKKEEEQGAGDQGMMFGYASSETPEYMPLPIILAHKLTMKLSEVRKSSKIPYLRPDGKSQVSVEYSKEGKPLRVDSVVISTQHSEKVSKQEIERDIMKYVIEPVCLDWLDTKTKFYINPTGLFVRG